MNAFEFERPVKEDHRARANVGAVSERELKWMVVCEQCRGGWLWRCRDESTALGLVAAHAGWSGHVVSAKLRVISP